MGEPPKPPFYDSAMFWLAVCGVLELIGGIPAAAVIAQAVGNPRIDVFSSGWFLGGAGVMGLGIVAAWWALTLFVANFHFRRWQRGLQVAPGTIVNNYHGPVTQHYGVDSTPTAVQPVPSEQPALPEAPPETLEAVPAPHAAPEPATEQDGTSQ